jgi:hypothetical protein
MIASNLPRRFAVAGIVLGFVFMALHWYEYKYNPFHLPSSEATQTLPSYSAPPLYNLVENGMFVLCPGLLLQVFTIGTGDRVAWIMWVLAALVNGPIYYVVGLILAALMKGRSHVPTG